MSATVDPRYPIGKFLPPSDVTSGDLAEAIQTLRDMPAKLRKSIQGLMPEQMNTPYREGGWTVRQVVHHVADSHSTALFRTKKALTEEWPAVPGYREAEFAQLPDMRAPVELSLTWLDSVHARWTMLLQTLDDSQWKRGYVHEERGRQVLDFVTVHYAWHARHHVAHITTLREQRGW